MLNSLEEDEMKISIIVPVYKVEKYIEQCIHSVKVQTFQNWELILVDDGSPDKCPEICDELVKADKRIKVVHQKNGGLSAARNRGLQEVTGDYVMFLDSDDYWDNERCLEIIVEKLQKNKTDMLTFRYKKYIESTGEYIPCLPECNEEYINEIASKTERFKRLLGKGLYLSSACNKVMKTDFLKEKQLYFREGITSEDIDWCARCMLYTDDIIYSNIDCYVYRQRDYSISHSISLKNIVDLRNNITECVSLGKSLRKSDEFFAVYHTFVAYQYGVFLCTNTLVKDRQVREIVKEMESYKWLLEYRSNKKIKALYLVNKTLGYRNLIRCMKIYAKIRKG